MNNLERITKTIEVGQLQWYGRNDVIYLLSIIEQFSGTLAIVEEYGKNIVVPIAMGQSLSQIATFNLQAIRGN